MFFSLLKATTTTIHLSCGPFHPSPRGSSGSTPREPLTADWGCEWSCWAVRWKVSCSASLDVFCPFARTYGPFARTYGPDGAAADCHRCPRWSCVSSACVCVGLITWWAAWSSASASCFCGSCLHNTPQILGGGVFSDLFLKNDVLWNSHNKIHHYKQAWHLYVVVADSRLCSQPLSSCKRFLSVQNESPYPSSSLSRPSPFPSSLNPWHPQIPWPPWSSSEVCVWSRFLSAVLTTITY